MKKIIFKSETFGDISVEMTDKVSLNEQLTNDDIKEVQKMFTKLFKDSIPDIEKKIKEIVKSEIDSKVTEEKIVEISRNCIVQLYKTLWIRRSTWANGIKNQKA